MAATLTASASQTEKVALYVADARSMGVPVLVPEINASFWDFAIEDVDVTEPMAVQAKNRPSVLGLARSRMRDRRPLNLSSRNAKPTASSRI